MSQNPPPASALIATDGTHTVTGFTKLNFTDGATISQGASPGKGAGTVNIALAAGSPGVALESGSTDEKISAMPAAGNITGPEILAGVQGGANVGVTVEQLLTATLSGNQTIALTAGTETAGNLAGGAATLAGGGASGTGTGGLATVQGGVGGNTGGGVTITGGAGATAGGAVAITAGAPTTGNLAGSNLTLSPGAGSGTGAAGSLKLTNATTTTGASAGNLANCPIAGSATEYLEIYINGTLCYIPAWHA